MTKPSCGQICCTCTPCVVHALGTSYKEVISHSLINRFSLSSIKWQFLNSCPTCWQYAHANVISTMGCVFIIDIFCWTNGHLIVPITGTFDQTFLVSGCCEVTFRPSTPSSTRWLCLQAQMLLAKERMLVQF
jgi:hypothetical protein